MNRTLLRSLLAVVCALAHSQAAPKAKTVAPISPPTGSETSDASHVSEFSNDDLSLVLRTLARQAKLNIVLSPEVSGTVTLRLENKTPRAAMEIIAQANGLIMEDRKGILYVSSKNPNAAAAAKKSEPEKSIEDAMASMFTPAVIKFFDSFLDYQAKPETARKTAKAKRALYEALIAEGFSKDEALKIILADREFSIPGLTK